MLEGHRRVQQWLWPWIRLGRASFRQEVHDTTLAAQEPHLQLNNLPGEVLVLIFSHTTGHPDVFGWLEGHLPLLRLVCKHWRDLYDAHVREVALWVSHAEASETPVTHPPLGCFQNLRSVYIDNLLLDSQDVLTQLSHIDRLTVQHRYRPGLPNAGLSRFGSKEAREVLARAPRLKTLRVFCDMRESDMEDTLKCFAQLSRLESLHLRDCSWVVGQQQTLSALSILSQLSSLRLDYVDNPDEKLQVLSTLTRLHCLHIAIDCIAATKRTFEALANAAALRDLFLYVASEGESTEDLEECGFDIAGLSALTRLSSLDSLRVSLFDRTHRFSSDLSVFTKFSHVRSLGLEVSKPTPEGLDIIASLPNLTTLSVFVVPAASLVTALRKLSNLQELWLNYCTDFNGERLREIVELAPRLQSLRLPKHFTMDAGKARALRQLRHLRVLKLPSSTTDECLSLVFTFGSLRFLDLSGCRRITAAGLSHLRHSGNLRRIAVPICHGRKVGRNEALTLLEPLLQWGALIGRESWDWMLHSAG